MSQETTEAETAAELGRILDRIRANQFEIERLLRGLTEAGRAELWRFCVEAATSADVSPDVRSRLRRCALAIDAVDLGNDPRPLMLGPDRRDLFARFTEYLRGA
jgi:hypothetical protein